MLKQSFRFFYSLIRITPFKIASFFILLFLLAFVDKHFTASNFLIGKLFSFPEKLAYDIKIKNKAKREHHQKVAVIGIDEKSVATLGRFPFDRKIFADFQNSLKNYGVKIIAYDMVFSEAEKNSAMKELNFLRKNFPNNLKYLPIGQRYYDFLGKRKISKDGDTLFSEALSSGPPTILGYFFQSFGFSSFLNQDLNNSLIQYDESVLQQSSRVISNLKGTNNLSEIETIMGSHPTLPLQKFLPNRNVHIGFFNFLPDYSKIIPDYDGLIRDAPLLSKFNDSFVLSLSTKAVELLAGESAVAIIEKSGIRKLQIGKYHIPVDPFGRLRINFNGPSKSISTYEFVDVLESKVAKEALKDKIVFIGPTAIGLKDTKPTPIDPHFPGVEVHANIVENILSNDYIVVSEKSYTICLLLLTVGALIFSFVVSKLPSLVSVLSSVLLIAIMLYVDQHFLFNQGLEVPTAVPALQFFFIAFSLIMLRLVTSDKEKKFIRGAFSHYVSGNIVNSVLKDRKSLQLGGEKKELSVMFADIEGFTSLSEKLEVQEVTKLLNEIFTEFTEIILENEGTFDKYLGDAVMCFWGAPLDQAKHAHLACETAVKIIERLEIINKRWQKQHNLTVNVRIGINTGEMSVGNLGSKQIFDYTVLGDKVNLASRLEDTNKLFRTNILVGKRTAELCEKEMLFRYLGAEQIKGKQKTVEIFELVGMKPVEQALVEWVNTFEIARKSYESNDWNEAKRIFHLCKQLQSNDYASDLFLQRIEENSAEVERFKNIRKLS